MDQTLKQSIKTYQKAAKNGWIAVIVILIIFLVWGIIWWTRSDSLNNSDNTKPKNVSKGEHACRQALERIYRRPFKSIRPNFLKNPKTGKNMEIDCYNEELKIGLEYQGEQHYRFPTKYHKTEEAFSRQQERDRLKAELCAQNGVHLIIVPWIVSLKDIPEYIRERLPK